MIARALIPILLTILLADLFIDRRFLRRLCWWKRLIWWIPALLLSGWAIMLSTQSGFVAGDQAQVELFLLVFALIAAPKALFAVCSAIGRLLSKGILSPLSSLLSPLSTSSRLQPKRRKNYGNLVGLLCVPLTWYIVLYGAFVGFYQLEVKHIELTFSDLPAAFDGYRILHFSDAHVGTLRGNRQQLLRQIVDSINAQQADLIAFTGDLQNTQPQDLYPHLDLLSTLKARDGVFSVLGNHDYAEYTDCDEAVKVANCRETVSLERQLGWTLLLNEHRRISRGSASIVIAGMENDGEGRFRALGDINRTLATPLPSKGGAPSTTPLPSRGGARGGVNPPNDFIVMLEHDPSSWRRKIVPESRSQLTLSGHTHGGQISLLGWLPISLVHYEHSGIYEEGDQRLCVSTGVGALIPFRFGMKGEIIVITLKKK